MKILLDLQKLKGQRDKLVTERDRIIGVEKESREGMEKILSDSPTEELDERTERIYSALRTKAECCPARTRRLNVEIEEIDALIAAENTRVLLLLDRQSTYDQRIALEELTDVLTPFCADKRAAITLAESIVDRTARKAKATHAASQVNSIRSLASVNGLTPPELCERILSTRFNS